MAKKQQYTAEQMAEAIIRAKGMISIAARNLGCERSTVYSYIKQYKAVAQAVEDARENMIDFVEGKLYEQISVGNPTAIIFYLKTQGKERGYVERQEMTGANGGDITITVKRG